MQELRRMTKKQAKSPTVQFWKISLSIFTYLFIFEIFTRIFTSSPEINPLSYGLISTALFSLAATFLILSFIYLFPEKYHHIYASIFMLILFIFYTSQNIYHDIFRTFYFYQSVEHLGQGLGFKGVINRTLLKNIWWILIALTTIALYLYTEIKKRKKHLSNRFDWPSKMKFISIFFACAIIFHFLAIANVKGNEQAKDLYYNSYATNLSVDKLGLLTTFRLDIQRSLTNWSPTMVEVPSEEHKGTDEEPPWEKEQVPEIDTTPTYGENKLDIAFDELIEETSSSEVAELHRYFQQQVATQKNEYTGKYEGYNLIWITAEGYAPYAVREDLTPTLYKLSNEGYQFTNFYNPIWGVSTSDGEYTILNSLVPKPGVWSFSKSGTNAFPFAIGNQLKEAGYTTKAYHNHTYDYYDRHISHPNIGYDYKGVGNGLNMEALWPRSDLEMVEKTLDEFINEDPFHIYYMTVSGHLEYNFIGNHMAMKNRHYVEHLPLSEQAQAYIAGQIELDLALELLLKKLEEADLLDETLIVLTGDHYPYGLENETIEELTGEPLDEKFGLYKSEWILYATDMKEEQVVVEEPSYTLDMLPTVSNLMGLDFDSRLFMGRDVFSASEPLVVFSDKSFITKDFTYYLPEDEITSLTGETIDQDYFRAMKQRTEEIFYYSMKILDLDYYSHIKWKKTNSD